MYSNLIGTSRTPTRVLQITRKGPFIMHNIKQSYNVAIAVHALYNLMIKSFSSLILLSNFIKHTRRSSLIFYPKKYMNLTNILILILILHEIQISN